MMSPEAWLTLLTIAGCLIGLVQNRYPPELVLVTGVILLMFADVIEVQQVLAGFSNEGMITVAVLYVVANGLTQTGAVSWLSQSLLGKPKSITVAQVRVMLPVSIVSSVLNNTPVVAMLVPAIKDWAKRYQLPASQLMIPLSYAAIIGGTCSLVGTSTNLVVNDMLKEHLDEGLEIFEIAWVGVPLVLATVVYTMCCSRWLLPNKIQSSSPFEDTRQYVVEMMVERFSPLAGKSIGDAGLRNLPGAFLVEIQRNGRVIPAVTPEETLYAEDRLVFAGNVESMVDLKKIHGLRSAEQQVFKLDAARSDRCLVEVVISPKFPLLGKTVRDSRFRSHYDTAIIAVAREGERIEERIGDIELRPGDTLLLEAHEEFVENQRYSRDFLLVSQIENSQPILHERRSIALALLLMMVIMVATGFLSMFKAGVFTAAALIATGCVNITEIRKIIQWDVLAVIVASIALGTAVQSSGASSAIANLMTGMAGESPWLVLVMIFVLTSAFSAVISNLAAAVLMFPVALASSEQLEVSLTPMAITLMVAASASFSTPIGYQTNLMVYGPGDYKFMDYVRMGGPLTILIGILTTILVPMIWPF